MKKHSRRAKNGKKPFFNKLGMTYVELLCALSLLTLIVVMFTPMLLSSYETLYEAGERVEEVYDSKKELESGLADRLSEVSITISNVSFTTDLSDNAAGLFEAMNVKLKKVVSTMEKGLETAFGTTRATVDIISPRIVYDDQNNHDVIIQTNGIEYSKVIFGTYSSDQDVIDKNNAEMEYCYDADNKVYGTGAILVEIIIPDKKGDLYKDEDAVYLKANVATIKSSATATDSITELKISNEDNNGIISFNVSGGIGDAELDFTQSPVRITVYYVNTRGKVRTVSDYLTIEPPTILLAGDTDTNIDYYTSAGVTEKDGVYSLVVNPRKMRVANSGLFQEKQETVSGDTPSEKGVRFQAVTWVDQDENSKLRPYYVMAGTNSSVYRMYNFSKTATVTEVLAETTDNPSFATVTNTTDASTILSDGTRTNPSFWSGEMSDQYSFQTMKKSSTYGKAKDNDVDCSAGNSDYGVIGTKYDKFDGKLRYSMVFNSFRTDYEYASQMSRRISYVLTEAGNHSFRIAGKKRESGHFEGYNQIWEYSGDYNKTNVTYTDNELAQYFYTGTGTTNPHTDKHMAYLRLNSYTQINPLDALSDDGKKIYNNNNTGMETLHNRLVVGGEFWSPDKSEETIAGGLDWYDRVNYITTDQGCKVNVSSIAYLPGSSSGGKGQVIYFGSVPAYALIRQSSDIETGQARMFNCNSRWFVDGELRASAATMYLVCGSKDDTTTIYRNAYGGEKGNKTEVNDALRIMRADIAAKTTRDVTDVNAFYTSGNDSDTYKLVDNDTAFTFGYCSRWRMTVGNVTFDGTTEETKSYEKYYKKSYPNWSYTRKPSNINGGGIDNIYYNIWFPGEYYNLTQTATLDEVTVAVGYTVSGSSFMEQSAYASGYYGTALGSVYNDGVLAAYTETGNKVSAGLEKKGKQNIIFQNLLYYKSPKFTNETLHSRESVRFTAVDLISFTEPGTGNKVYQAIYGDNHGKLYFSTVATSKVTNIGGTEGGAVESDVTLLTLSAASDVLELTYSDADPTAIIGTTSFSTIFSEITSIEAGEDIVIVTGPSVNGGIEQFAVFERTDHNSNNWTLKRVYNGTFKGVVNKAMLLGDYYYIAGDGWVAAVSIDTIKATEPGRTISNKTESLTAPASETGVSDNKDHLLWVKTDTNIYALDGRITEG